MSELRKRNVGTSKTDCDDLSQQISSTTTTTTSPSNVPTATPSVSDGDTKVKNELNESGKRIVVERSTKRGKVSLIGLFALFFLLGISARIVLNLSSSYGNDDTQIGIFFPWQNRPRGEKFETLEETKCPKRDEAGKMLDQGVPARRIAQHRKPQVFSAIECFEWWDYKLERHDIKDITDVYMGRHRLKHVRLGGNPVFSLRNVPNRTYLRTKNIDLIGSKDPITEYEVRNTTLDMFYEFPRRWVMADGSRTRGYAQVSNSIEGTSIEAEITATGRAVLEFALDETSKASRYGLKHDIGTKTVIWLNTKGSTSGVHFDRTHNFVIQLDGSKRWTLYPPSEWPDLQFYPYMHSQYDTSRLPLGPDFNNNGNDDDDGVRSMTIETGPGDILYIPPFWSTKVESMKDSAHLSVNSASLEQMLLAKAYWRVQDFPSEWSKSQRLAAFWGLLNAICRALNIVDGEATSAAHFLHVGLRSRYQDLLHPVRKKSTDSNSKIEDLDLVEKEEEQQEEIQCESTLQVSRRLMDEYEILSAEIANDLAEISTPIVQIFVLDLAEELIMNMLGTNNPEMVTEFVKSCL
jgi:hypothetical protein